MYEKADKYNFWLKGIIWMIKNERKKYKYLKILKFGTPEYLPWLIKNEIVYFKHALISSEDADRMANSADSDQTALKEQSDPGLRCLHIPISSNALEFYGILVWKYIVKIKLYSSELKAWLMGI